MWLDAPASSSLPHFDGHQGLSVPFGMAAVCACAAVIGASENLPCIEPAIAAPVSLITGFLGSGKTTLLNRLLRHDGMKDSAVIINEYGEIALDHLLVERVEGEVAVLASGCICCTIRSDLEQTLRTLLVRRDRDELPPFRRILVETTGLADPAPIV